MKAIRPASPIAVALALATSAACPGASLTQPDVMKISNETSPDLHSLMTGRIYFSHQSVGASVLDGLESLSRESGIRLTIASPQEAPAGPAIIHDTAGANGSPYSKIDHFAAAIAGLAERPRVAMLKLCFADITPETDIEALFTRYRDTLSTLQRQYPEVTFVPVTVPLTMRPTGPKARLYRLVGRPVWEDVANVRRGAFNERLRVSYQDQPLFDLAAIEATRPDGGLETFSDGGKSHPSLFEGYAADEGHLNARGRRLAAAAFAEVVVRASSPAPKTAHVEAASW